MDQATYTRPDGTTTRRWKLLLTDGRVRITWAVTKQDARFAAECAGLKVRYISPAASMLESVK